MASTATRRTNRGAPALPSPPRRTRRRSWMRSLSTVLIVVGALLLIDASLTVLWREPITSAMASHSQAGLRDDLDTLRAKTPTPQVQSAMAALDDDRRRIDLLANDLRRTAKDGDAIARIEIPKIGASFVVVKGTDPADLRKGPGFYDDLPLPGEPGTTAIAGHRTTYLAPFRKIDQLREGDRITVSLPYAEVTYLVEGTRIVQPDDLSVLKRVGHDRLVLTACTPLFSAAQRIAVFARLEGERPGASIRRMDDLLGHGVNRTSRLLKRAPPGRR